MLVIFLFMSIPCDVVVPMIYSYYYGYLISLYQCPFLVVVFDLLEILYVQCRVPK
jgi:hypothetical protein